MTTGKPGMRTVIPMKGRVGKNLRERKINGITSNPKRFLLLFGVLAKK